jgi:pro-apoptotic serine protease NMA111
MAAAVTTDKKTDPWSDVINRVSRSVVVVHIFTRHAFEGGDQAFSSEGTGFVVDADLGIILTNR